MNRSLPSYFQSDYCKCKQAYFMVLHDREAQSHPNYTGHRDHTFPGYQGAQIRPIHLLPLSLRGCDKVIPSRVFNHSNQLWLGVNSTSSCWANWVAFSIASGPLMAAFLARICLNQRIRACSTSSWQLLRLRFRLTFWHSSACDWILSSFAFLLATADRTIPYLLAVCCWVN